MSRYRLDGSYRRPGKGATLIGGSPLRLFTLGAGGVRVVEAIERGDNLPAGHHTLTDRLIDAGVVHPEPDLTDDGVRLDSGGSTDGGSEPIHVAHITVVIPAFGELPRCLADPARPWPFVTVVVDDASPTPLHLPDGLTNQVRLIRLDTNIGPGGARNAGLDAVDTPWVAFVDADVEIDASTLVALAAHLRDERVALVAPRIRAEDARGVLARFERSRSPLDMGPEPARVAPTTRVSYVPAAVVLSRTDAVRAAGGFDSSLRYGEDVDLVWRLVAAGWRCRYEPRCTAHHRTRPTLAAWVAQRFRYGTSAAPLASRHPGALAPVRMSPWSFATWAALLVGVPIVGPLVSALVSTAIGLGTALALVRKLPSLPARESLRLAGLGHLYAGRLLATTLLRVWWPVALAAALVSRRARRALVAIAVISAALDIGRDQSDLDPVRCAALHLLDDVAYGAGVWAGSWRERRVDALLPTLETWPPRVPSP